MRESPDETAKLVETYRALITGAATAEEAWRTLRADGGYGVVRGSLRVLQ